MNQGNIFQNIEFHHNNQKNLFQCIDFSSLDNGTVTTRDMIGLYLMLIELTRHKTVYWCI